MLYTEGFTLFILSDAIINFKIISLHFGPLFGQSLTLKWDVELISNCDYTDVQQSVGDGHDVVVTIAQYKCYKAFLWSFQHAEKRQSCL